MDSVNEKSLWLGLVGSVLLIVGVFLPLVSAPSLGSINYFRNGSGDGVIVLGFGVISIVLAITGRYRGLWLPGLGSLLLLIYTFYGFRKLIGETSKETMKLLSPELQWGWGVLLAGAALIMAAASLHPLTTAQKRSAAMWVLAGSMIGGGILYIAQRPPTSLMTDVPELAPARPTASAPALPLTSEETADCSSYAPDMPSGVRIIVGMRDNVFIVHRAFKTSPAVISYLLTLKSMRAKEHLGPCAGIPYTTPRGYISGTIYLLDEIPSDGALRDFQNQDYTDLPILSSIYGSYFWSESGQDEAAVGFERNGRQYNGYRRLSL